MITLVGAALELRSVARRAIALDCDLITTRCDAPLAGRCFDLSPRGMALESAATVDAGESVVVCFRPPRGSETLTLFGRVRHASGPLRVQFEAMTMEEHICLFDALRGIPPRLPDRERPLVT